MTDSSGGQATRPARRPPWTDRGREAARETGRQLVAGLRSLWARLLPLLQKLWAAADGDVPPPPVDEGLKIEHRERLSPMVVAAKGHVFTFTVHTVLIWSATGLRPAELIWCARQFRPAVIQRLRRLVAEQARDVAPLRAGDLEIALQAALKEQPPWPFARAGRAVECRPEVWQVRHDDRVRETLRPHWDRLIELECEYELYLTRARYAEELNRRWVTILDEMADGCAGGEEAESFTEELSRARQHMAAEQQAAAQWSAELLRDRRRFDRIFEPFSAIPIVPQQAAGPTGEAAGCAPKAGPAEPAGQKVPPAEPAGQKVPPAEPAGPEPGRDERN
ncbi:hypothetical protein GA0074695_3387 [Micromonospora viridifaciens]|uniref:Uncharacterized protein n=1 Tax=Micromonospora viridifaciens TaxID=1881 RepID=A0A1C4XK97_MICVI|nr:hypothetical protein [Micromonospora viridifaciens]SCF08905.1 hypothetical protein GA0074695_3387 [Micromonospora viridifaciens]